MASNKQIGTTIPDLSEEEIKSFDKQECGHYKMTTKVILRNRMTGKVQNISETVSDCLYDITSEDEYDEKLEYDDIDGKKKFIKFKAFK